MLENFRANVLKAGLGISWSVAAMLCDVVAVGRTCR